MLYTFSKLKAILSEIHLLLTPDREPGKVFEKVHVIEFRRAKSLKHILLRAKVAPLEKKEVCCRSGEGTRCEISKHAVTTETFSSFSTQREYYIKPNNLTEVPALLCIFFYAKNAQSNTQVVLKIFDISLRITNQLVGVSLKGIPSNKCHLTLTLTMTSIMV